MNYPSAEQILFLHARIITETGGSHGVREIGMLQSAIGRPLASFGGKDLYPDIYSKAGALMHSLIQNHPFLDGNKRTAIAAAVVFLRMNNYSFTASNAEMASFTLSVARGEMDQSKIASWLRDHSQS